MTSVIVVSNGCLLLESKQPLHSKIEKMFTKGKTDQRLKKNEGNHNEE